MGSTLIARGFSDIGHVSGYTGHVMGIRECELGKSFGHITQAAGHTRLNPKDGRMCVLAEGGRFYDDAVTALSMALIRLRRALLATAKAADPFPHNRSTRPPTALLPKPVYVLQGTSARLHAPS